MTLERTALFWILVAGVVVLALATLGPVLLPFVVGLALAYFLNPVVDQLSRVGIPRVLSAALLMLVSAVALIAAMVFLAPVLADQAQALIAALPSEAARLRALAEAFVKEQLGASYPEAEAALGKATAGLTDALPALVANMAQSLWSRGSAAFNLLSLLLVTPLVAFYTLVDWPKIVATVDSWVPLKSAPHVRAIASEIDMRVSAFIRGQGTVCLVLAVFYAIALTFVGLRYGLLVGLATGLMSFIPFVGWAMGLIVALGLGVVQFWPDITPILMIGGVFLAGQALDAAILGPQIVGSKIGLHPVWLIFSLLVFSYLFGFLGLLVAVPVAAAIGVVVRFAINSYLQSPVYHGQG
ncbi:MAG: AI-2E family transporter [Hyphomicrobium sp.]